MRRLPQATLLAAGLLALNAQAEGLRIEAELGASWLQRNDVRIPNDESADRFDLRGVTGSGPWPTLRLNGTWDINERHGVRLVLAPLSIDERGSLSEDVRFSGETFAAGTPVNASYRFNSWRLGYRFRWYDTERWTVWVGATAKIRDAEIELRQGEVSASDDNVGFVPLLYLAGEYRYDDRWSLSFDFDGLAGGPGRAFDISAKVNYRLGDTWQLSAGYRGLEGGADTDDVYNFAWFNTALLAVQYSF